MKIYYGKDEGIKYEVRTRELTVDRIRRADIANAVKANKRSRSPALRREIGISVICK